MKTTAYQKMTYDQIKDTYPDSWVLVANPVTEPAKYEIISGIPLYGNKNKKKVLACLESLDYKGKASVEIDLLTVIYTGEILMPENHFICL